MPVFTDFDGNADEEWSDQEGAFVQRAPAAAHDFEGANGSHMGALDAHDLEQGGGSHLGMVENNDAKDAKGKFLAHADKESSLDAKPGVSNIAGPKQGVASGLAQRRATNPGSAEMTTETNEMIAKIAESIGQSRPGVALQSADQHPVAS